MSTTARAAANRAQRAAADPTVSAFVAASAGSGKTKLLTDRLLRLMLAGADPARIQCLTFTKAAAAEMAVRLRDRLGQWVSLDDSGLDGKLGELGDFGGLDDAGHTANRARARALFARVLDLPGGMRIGTIHAFCQSLLRRFPLEAQLSPHFRLIDDVDAKVALAEARETMLGAAHEPASRAALEQLAGLVTLSAFGLLVDRLRTDPVQLDTATADGPAALEARLRQRLAARAPGEVTVAMAAEADEPELLWAIGILRQAGPPKGRERGARLAAWLGCDPDDRQANIAEWREAFFAGSGKPRTPGGVVAGKFGETYPEVMAVLLAEQARLMALDDAARAWEVAAISAALASLAAPVARAYAASKDARGLLDYDDLIGRTSALLVDPGAAWVLYKLDGGLDHLLLDEVQDTSDAQWRIAGALSAEFFAGRGARDGGRTVFAVGDPKQSIYSFQGANPAAFQTWRDRMRAQVEHAEGRWRDEPLDVSFRSTTPVLDLVDAVFAAAPASDGVAEPGSLRHLADRAGHAGRVELWPLAPRPTPDAADPWAVPDRNQRALSAPQLLAETLAAWIAGQTDGSVMQASRGRPLAAGDVLVLVRRRNAFGRALVRALKARGVAVAGLDRMVLTEQPAVADLLSLCDVLLLPDDDLALACVLTSPLGGLHDDSLMALAVGRTGSLWQALRTRAGRERDRHPDWYRAYRFIATLLSRVDYASPHALLSEALGTLGARARLFARLGPEAADPIDELLRAALAYAAAHPASLQGFVHWLRRSGAEVKREAEGAGDVVRVMTVHGAKGLQAPLVILPDTTGLPPQDDTVLWTCGLPIWSPQKTFRCAAVDLLRADAARAAAEEQNRLLYVALTRAEDRLVICGWESHRALPPTSWYELVRQGFARLDAGSHGFDAISTAWPGAMLVHVAAQTAAAPAKDGPVAAASSIAPAWLGRAPDWRARPPPPEPALPARLAPSRPEGAELGVVPQAASPLLSRDTTGQRFRRGQLVHALLQHLPALDPASRADAARKFLDRPGLGIAREAVAGLVGEVLAVLEHPDLAGLFTAASRAEAPLTGVVGGQVVGGLVDRLAVLDGRVVVADYKTNRQPPADAASVPVLYLRQMAAYRAVLAEVFPGRAVACVLIWTVGPVVMPLPDSLLDRHAPGAPLAA